MPRRRARLPVKRRIIDVFPAGAIWEYYGASEGMACVHLPEEWLTKPGSVGRPFRGCPVRNPRRRRCELPPGEVGAIYISSFSGQRFGYHNDPEKTDPGLARRLLHGGRSGLARRRRLSLPGRPPDRPHPVRRGERLPRRGGDALAEDPDVVDAAVFGLPDERMGPDGPTPSSSSVPGRRATPGPCWPGWPPGLAELQAPRGPSSSSMLLPREENGKVMKARLRAERMEPATAGLQGEGLIMTDAATTRPEVRGETETPDRREARRGERRRHLRQHRPGHRGVARRHRRRHHGRHGAGHRRGAARLRTRPPGPPTTPSGAAAWSKLHAALETHKEELRHIVVAEVGSP